MKIRLLAVLMTMAVVAGGSIWTAAAGAAAKYAYTGSGRMFFSGGGAGEAQFEISDGATFLCKEAGNGQWAHSPATTLELTVSFTNCTGGCLSMYSRPLVGTLGDINAAKNEVGVLLKPASGTSFFTGHAGCGGIGNGEVQGSVIGRLTAVGKKAKSLTASFKYRETAKQEVTKFEGESSENTLHIEFSKPAALALRLEESLLLTEGEGELTA